MGSLEKKKTLSRHFHHLRKIPLLMIPVFTLLLFNGCSGNIRNYREIRISVNDEVNISPRSLHKFLKVPMNRKMGRGIIEIMIYSYSSGAEILEYSDEKGFSQRSASGKIKAMIKYRRENRVEDVRFISVEGKNNDEILKKLFVKINRILGGNR